MLHTFSLCLYINTHILWTCLQNVFQQSASGIWWWQKWIWARLTKGLVLTWKCTLFIDSVSYFPSTSSCWMLWVFTACRRIWTCFDEGFKGAVLITLFSVLSCGFQEYGTVTALDGPYWSWWLNQPKETWFLRENLIFSKPKCLLNIYGLWKLIKHLCSLIITVNSNT